MGHIRFVEMKERKEQGGGTAFNNANKDTWDCAGNCEIMTTSNRTRDEKRRCFKDRHSVDVEKPARREGEWATKEVGGGEEMEVWWRGDERTYGRKEEGEEGRRSTLLGFLVLWRRHAEGSRG